MTDTQSMIAVQEKDNTVSSLVLDHDGDLETAGRILEENYQDYEQVLALVNLGDLKRLGKTAEESRDRSHTQGVPAKMAGLPASPSAAEVSRLPA